MITLSLKADKKTKNLSGLTLGKKFREKFELDKYDETEDMIFIDISTKIFSMNYQFFMGLFADSIKKLGTRKFNLKYQFITGINLKTKISKFIEQAEIDLIK